MWCNHGGTVGSGEYRPSHTGLQTGSWACGDQCIFPDIAIVLFTCTEDTKWPTNARQPLSKVTSSYHFSDLKAMSIFRTGFVGYKKTPGCVKVCREKNASKRVVFTGRSTPRLSHPVSKHQNGNVQELEASLTSGCGHSGNIHLADCSLLSLIWLWLNCNVR